MHKFFCNFNALTGKSELAPNKSIFARAFAQTEEETLSQIKKLIQNLYENTNKLKDITTSEKHIENLNEIELLISNLYYSLFASPMELENENKENSEIKQLVTNSIELASNLEKLINIPEYNRLASIIRNDFQNMLNQL
jgi:phosphoglycerate-specific signal transduction histidine kinase